MKADVIDSIRPPVGREPVDDRADISGITGGSGADDFFVVAAGVQFVGGRE